MIKKKKVLYNYTPVLLKFVIQYLSGVSKYNTVRRKSKNTNSIKRTRK